MIAKLGEVNRDDATLLIGQHQGCRISVRYRIGAEHEDAFGIAGDDSSII
ncbi:MAG: hypothetical protein R3F31_18440 [Verrucomicrobiales bacterium]